MSGEDRRSASLRPEVPHLARVYDHWLGGKNNFASDRELAQQVMEVMPGITESVQINRAFLGRSVLHLAGQGIRQFLDIGTGLPAANNTHEVAQHVAPTSRVVYVDNDPIVLVHARALLTSDPRGATSYIDADLRDTDTILKEATGILDFRQPVAVMLVAILHCLAAEDDPYGVVRTLMNAVPSGSYLVISHPANDVVVEQMAATDAYLNELLPHKITTRSHAEVVRFFDGLELLEPGVVLTNRWRVVDPRSSQVWAGVARKP